MTQRHFHHLYDPAGVVMVELALPWVVHPRLSTWRSSGQHWSLAATDLIGRIYSRLNALTKYAYKYLVLTRRVKIWIAAGGTCGLRKTDHDPSGVVPRPVKGLSVEMAVG